MSTQTITKKRKSADGSTTATKKVKTTKSADRPAPVKSALKKTKTAKKAETEAPTQLAEDVEEETVIPEAGANTDLTPDQTAALLAGFSSDEDEASDGDSGLAISSLPKAPTTGAVQKRINEAIMSQSKSKDGTEDPERTPGVIYIGRIPHGFFEHQMRAYFSQFGEITNLRLMRNRKSGKSQHHGFIEFASAAVADIVCKTMDKYLLFNHILQVRRVPREQVNENMWRQSSRRARNPPPRNKLEGGKLRRGATRDVWEARVTNEEKKRQEKAEKLKEMGYEFEMPALKGVGEVPVKPKAIEEASVTEDPNGADEGVVESVSVAQEGPEEVVEKKVSKKRPASGKTQVKKAVKKVKA
ncbi:nucleolar protein [Saxophila tyrrhenica]|uniref:Nucleolar protein n=1 Tax=Saxophila tyrrhenica TaxID=1690608 RepID=A0AAV9NVU1_9PEZI|nr:nucleolar protein [Saxophila tyrrhenica]